MLYHTELMQMSTKINQLQFKYIEQVAEMLRRYLFSSHLFVERVCGQDLSILIILKYQSYKMTCTNIPKELNMHLMVQLSSISNLEHAI